jgi:monoamine oxidase
LEKQHVIIIGAGAAGLMAATRLSKKYAVTILEARAQLGGRIRGIRSPNSNTIIETGAEFIHGKLPLTLKLLKKTGIDPVPVSGNFYRREKGEWKEQEVFIEGWDKLLKKMKKVKKDMTMHEFLEENYGAAAHDTFRRHITAYTEGFDIADTNRAGVKALYKEWSHESDKNFRIPGGYGQLIDFLHRQCETNGVHIHMDQLVKQVDWEKGSVSVQTTNHQQYHADKLIITIPLGVLQKAGDNASVNFTPPIDDYIQAARDIGFGFVIKVIFLFRERFWKEDTGFVLSDEIFPTWWTQLPDTIPLLTGWCGGPKAGKLSEHSEEDILEKALASLASIFDKTIEELKANLIESQLLNWQQNTLTRGGYSYPTPASKSARKLLNTPIDDTLYFAGEGVYDGDAPGTVEAALVCGKEVAKKLLNGR